MAADRALRLAGDRGPIVGDVRIRRTVWALIGAAGMAGVLGSGVLVPVSVAPSASGFDSAGADRFVTGYLDRTGLPGAAVVVVHGDRVVHLAGYGDDGEGRRLTADTPMPIASLSKSVTAFAVMQLVESGRVRLDSQVKAYVPEFHMADDRADRITVRELLNQTSGMADTSYPAMHAPVAASLSEAVAQLSTARLANDPGVRWNYHNPNYQVLARLVEVVSGEEYDQYLRIHVFTPLGMNASRGVLTTGDLAGIAAGHVDGWGFALPVREMRWFVGGSGGVISTARDLGDWLILHLTADQPSVLTPAGIETMHTPSDPGNRYGFGWSVSGPASHRRISHNGALFTFTAFQVVVPASGYGVAVLANRGYTLGPNDAEAIGRGLLHIAEGERASVAVPWWRLVDIGLAAGTLAVIPVAARWVIRARRRNTSGRRPVWWLVNGAGVAAACLVALLGLPLIGGRLSSRRDTTLRQVAHISPAVVTLLVVTGAAALAGTVAIAIAAARRRRPPGQIPS